MIAEIACVRALLNLYPLLDALRQLAAALERARSLTSVKMEKSRTIVHFLGDAGAGKTTLKESLELSRSYFSSWFNVSGLP